MSETDVLRLLADLLTGARWNLEGYLMVDYAALMYNIERRLELATTRESMRE